MTSVQVSGLTVPPIPSDQDASGRQLGDEEIEMLARAVRSGTLTSTKGTFVKAFEEGFSKRIGVAHAAACASGTSAIHAAVAAIDPEPGDEIVTSPVTDMGAITPIIYQTAVPVFADVDASSGNITAETVERVLGPKTRAIVVTHLFGNPAEMGPILELAESRGIAVIEDCAQAFGATYDGRPVGTLGAIGCYSLQQGKHITTGEGGIVISNDDRLARRVKLFIDKAWGYGDPSPDHYFAALNGRMSELQGAVATAQLGKLSQSISQRQRMAERLTCAIGDIEGIYAPCVPKAGRHSFWKYALRVSLDLGGPDVLAAALRTGDIASAPRYIRKPAFECAVIRDQRTFGNSRFPFSLARPEILDYAPERYPGVYRFLRDVLVLPWNERLEESHVDLIADRLRAYAASEAAGAAQ
ncbi:GDP-perosamine synthase [Defluviimonas aquaemixtae]|uniref:GDP-perosamine synthase n=1 Tax=Albidovulum aquaemixtae TaxID=1542388 RepID=A0A2R8B1T9_9RHOB|nr:DegT/DnrJ/EryC1/StrS family aminotransferase [Defluviimonas aquaemixtae]SPH16604.1 GDP-perosamine synthase [Defluviimonas aquaemixtae]